jgi:hypothetical protein
VKSQQAFPSRCGQELKFADLVRSGVSFHQAALFFLFWFFFLSGVNFRPAALKDFAPESFLGDDRTARRPVAGPVFESEMAMSCP